jgi:hypothetical protein
MNSDSPEPYRFSSWSGSESHRREQGSCRPPQTAPNLVAHFCIAKDTPCQIRRVSETKWRSFRTRRDLGFDHYEFNDCGSMVFRDNGYQIRVPLYRVVSTQKKPF